MDINKVNEMCRRLKLKNYQINDDLSVDVNHVGHFGESVKLNKNHIIDGKFPIKFNKIKGRFECSWCNLTSLENGPKWVGGNFMCTHNSLTSLEGGPEYVGGLYNCRGNKLTSLKGIAKKVGFGKDPNKIGGDISDGVCLHENFIKDLDGFDCDFKGKFLAARNPITVLLGKNESYNQEDSEFIYWFKKLNVVDSGKLNLKKFKYLMNMFDYRYYNNYIRVNIHYIKKYYEIVD